MTCPSPSPWLALLRAEVLRRIKAQRSTQAALAAHLGITPKHMSQVLTGAVTGSPELLDRIAAAVGLRIAIVIGEGEPVTLPVDPRRRWREGREKGGNGLPAVRLVRPGNGQLERLRAANARRPVEAAVL